MPGKKSRNKGSGFERQIVKMFSVAYGVKLRRTPLSGGWAQDFVGASGDVVCVDDDVEFPYCIECKKAEHWRLESLFTDKHAWFDNWWAQLLDECPDGKHPLLVFSRNRMPIFVASTAEVMWGCPIPHMTLMIDNVTVVVITLLESFLKWDKQLTVAEEHSGHQSQ